MAPPAPGWPQDLGQVSCTLQTPSSSSVSWRKDSRSWGCFKCWPRRIGSPSGRQALCTLAAPTCWLVPIMPSSPPTEQRAREAPSSHRLYYSPSPRVHLPRRRSGRGDGGVLRLSQKVRARGSSRTSRPSLPFIDRVTETLSGQVAIQGPCTGCWLPVQCFSLYICPSHSSGGSSRSPPPLAFTPLFSFVVSSRCPRRASSTK